MLEESAFTRLVGYLSQLSQDQLKVVAGHVSALKRASSEDFHDYEWLLKYVYDELFYQGLVVRPLVGAYVRGTAAYTKHVEDLKTAAVYVDGLAVRCTSDVSRDRLRKVVAASFVSWWRDTSPKIPFTLQTIMQRIKYLPQAVEVSLPGYTSAGVLLKMAQGQF